MNTEQATCLFEALSSPARLRIFRLLVRHGGTGLVAGDIATHINAAPANASFHLKNLLHAGLVSVEQEGRFLRYRANILLMLDIVAFLTAECCADNPDQCQEFRKQSRVPATLFDTCGNHNDKT